MSGEKSSPSKKSKKLRLPITDVRYDFYNRPILGYNNSNSNAKDDRSSSLDGSWEVANPVDPVTGLWYQSAKAEEVTRQDSTSRGEGADWGDLIPTLLRHGYRTGLNVSSETWDFPLLLCERSYNPPPIRQQLLEILMEELQVSSVFLAKDAVMQCYACGRTQGTVVDMGYGGTTVTPVFEGYVEQHGIQRAPIGLSHIDMRVMEHMDELYGKQQQTITSGNLGFLPLYQVKQKRDLGWATYQRRAPSFHEAARLFVAQECRLMGAGIAVDTTTAATTTANNPKSLSSFQAPNKSFKLPDETEIQVSSHFRFHSANILVGRPQLVVTGAAADGAPPPAPPTTPMSSEQEARQRLFQKNKHEWMAYMQQQQQILDSSEQGNSTGGDGEQVNDEFSDATAVGIAKRRTKRQKIKDSTGTTRSSNKAMFSNSRLNAACAKYFQKIVDQSLTSSPIAQMICEAAYRCDRDQQPALLGNVILGGGGSCLAPTEQAVPDLIKEQTESLIHTHTPGWRIKMLAPAASERAVLPWLGGSILASLGSFHEMYVTRADYEEWGAAIVNRKCP